MSYCQSFILNSETTIKVFQNIQDVFIKYYNCGHLQSIEIKESKLYKSFTLFLSRKKDQIAKYRFWAAALGKLHQLKQDLIPPLLQKQKKHGQNDSISFFNAFS